MKAKMQSCNLCHRKVRGSFYAQWSHLQRFHLDHLIPTVVGVLANEENLFVLGQYLGKAAIRRLYAGKA